VGHRGGGCCTISRRLSKSSGAVVRCKNGIPEHLDRHIAGLLDQEY
jgi:hypothetical protein